MTGPDDEQEAVNGICCEDDELECFPGMFASIPKPRDPYGCENPVSQEDSD